MNSIISLKKMYFMIMKVYIFTIAFELPVRYILSRIHITEFIYIRDIMLILGIIIFLLFEKTKKIHLFCCMGFIFFALVGLYFTSNIIEVGMAIKTLLPFYYGMLLGKYYDKFNLNKEEYLKFLFWGISFGMMLQFIFDDLPWFAMENIKMLGAEGFMPNQMLVWLDTELPFTRMSGFCRLYNTTAIYVSYIIIWYIAYKPNLIYLCVGGVLLIGTLAKTSIGIYALLTTILIIKYISWRKYILSLKLMLIFFALNLFLLPLLSLLIISVQLELDTQIILFLLGGFDDRLVYSWPVTLDNIITYGNILLGRGIGGVGLSTTLFDTKLLIKPPIDNFAIFMYGTFGIAGIVLIIYYLNKVINMRIKSQLDHFLLLFTFVFFGNAIMADMTDTMSMFLLGIALSYICQINNTYRNSCSNDLQGVNNEISSST